MKTFSITATALALLSSTFGQGTFLHHIIVLSVLVFIGAPMLLFLSVWLLIGLKRSGGIPNGWQKTCVISAVIGVGLMLSLGTGLLIHHWEIRKVRHFVESTVHSLDDYHSKNGIYPPTLAELGILSVPKLLREPSGYTTTKDTFRFEYRDPSGIMDAYEFHSSSRKWMYFD